MHLLQPPTLTHRLSCPGRAAAFIRGCGRIAPALFGVWLIAQPPVLAAAPDGPAGETTTLTAGPDTTAPDGPADAYYRWIDQAGRVHYTDFEPVGVPAQRIPLTPPAEEDAPVIAGATADRQPDPFHDQDAQILPIEHIGPCADARQQLAVLHAAVPVYRDDQGQYRAAWRGDGYRGKRDWLDADDRTAAIGRARGAVLRQCSDPAAFEREVEAFDAELGKH